jgi:hypothetical protein
MKNLTVFINNETVYEYDKDTAIEEQKFMFMIMQVVLILRLLTSTKEASYLRYNPTY